MTNLSSPAELKRQRLKQQYAQLEAQHAAVAQQLRTDLNAANRPVLEERLTNIEQELDTVWGQLQHLEQAAPGSDIAQRQGTWKGQLWRIDFDKTWHHFESLYREHIHRESGGAALLLAPNCNAMRADLFVQRLLEWLKSRPGGYSRLDHRITGFEAHVPLTPQSFLAKLGNEFGCAPETDLRELPIYVDQLTRRMCSALGTDHVLFVEVNLVVDLYTQDAFVTWLLDEFWPALMTSLQHTAARSPFVKCIMYVGVKRRMPRTSPLRSRCCPLLKYVPTQRQFAQLQLSHWTSEEIKEWLVTCSGIRWDARRLNEVTQTIFAASEEGMPVLVCHELNQLFLDSVGNHHHGGA